MFAVIATLPYDSPLERQKNGKDWHWYGPLTDMVAGIYDSTGVGVATQSQRAKWKRTEIPKPLTRPWEIITHEEKLGTRALPLDQLRKELGWD